MRRRGGWATSFISGERGRTVDQVEIDAWLTRMDHHDAEIARVEREMASRKGEAVTVSDTPPPASAATGESEIVR